MKLNKKSFATSADTAHVELKRSRRRFKRRRKTVLIRIQKKWHVPLKERARNKKKTLSKLHDEIYPHYFKHNKHEKTR